jgi:hypothetical protein
MKNILFIGLCFSIGLSVSSCCSTKDIQNDNTTLTEKIVTEYVHDTVYVIESDTSSFTANLIVSDSGQIFIQNTSSNSGKYLNYPKVVIKNNQIKIDCTAEAQRLFKQWKSKHILEKKSNTFTRTKLVEKELSLWQKFQIKLGQIAVLVALIWALYKLLKNKVKIKYHE